MQDSAGRYLPPAKDDGVRADLVVRGLWRPQADASLDICVTDADAESYKRRSVRSILKSHETRKKAHYRDVCRERRMDFTPVIMTCDGVYGREANTLIKHLARQLSNKRWGEGKSYGQVLGWMRCRLSFALVRAYSFCLRGNRQRVFKRGEILGCEGGAGIGEGMGGMG